MRMKRLYAVVHANNDFTRLDCIFVKRGVGGVLEQYGAAVKNISCRAKSDSSIGSFSRAINPGSFSAIEGHFLAVLCEKILAEKFSQMFEKIAKAAYNRIILADGILGLGNITDIYENQGKNRYVDEKTSRNEKNCIVEIRKFSVVGIVNSRKQGFGIYVLARGKVIS